MNDVTTSVLLKTIEDYKKAFVKVRKVMKSHINSAEYNQQYGTAAAIADCLYILNDLDPDFKEDK